MENQRDGEIETIVYEFASFYNIDFDPDQVNEILYYVNTIKKKVLFYNDQLKIVVSIITLNYCMRYRITAAGDFKIGQFLTSIGTKSNNVLAKKVKMEFYKIKDNVVKKIVDRILVKNPHWFTGVQAASICRVASLFQNDATPSLVVGMLLQMYSSATIKEISSLLYVRNKSNFISVKSRVLETILGDTHELE